MTLKQRAPDFEPPSEGAVFGDEHAGQIGSFLDTWAGRGLLLIDRSWIYCESHDKKQ